ncbi:MAG: helix-turn-helix transcriptional regulator [Acidobacteriia bacterium]|nr:helix-turn-helix transcriptional regulator [Terriglobia bacterium]
MDCIWEAQVRNTESETPAQVEITPAMFHILLALSAGERHGYGVMQEVEEDTEGTVQLPPGTLYRTIKILLAEGWIERSRGPESATDDTRRRYYRITDVGRDVAVQHAMRLAKVVELARARRLIPEPDLV